MKMILFCALFFVFCVFQTQEVLGADCRENSNSNLPKKLEISGAVFSGKVIALEFRKMLEIQEVVPQVFKNFTGDRKDFEVLTVKIQVYNWWKGLEVKEITLLAGHLKSSKGYSIVSSEIFNFRIGEEVLVFTNGRDKAYLQTSSCSGTGLLENKLKFLKMLGAGCIPK